MKKIILFFILGIGLINISCSETFLDRYPKGTWNKSNYTSNDSIKLSILATAEVQQTYASLRSWSFAWDALGMENYTTPDAYKGGGSASDGGSDIAQFSSHTYTSQNSVISDFYGACYSSIYLANQANALITTMSDTVQSKNSLLAQSLTLRSLMYFRLAQAFGGVPWVNHVLAQNAQTPPQVSRTEILGHIISDLTWAIPYLPSKQQIVSTGNWGNITQNGARAILAKVYLLQQNWASALAQTQAIISSGDNDLTTPYDEIYWESEEFGHESVLEVYCDVQPATKINIGSQWGEIVAFRGSPNYGWGFDVPTDSLIAAYETGDPREAETVLTKNEVINGITFKNAGYEPYGNRRFVPPAAETTAFGRGNVQSDQWQNIRLIRYADVVLMDAEAANELGQTQEALDKLEMVRARARGGNSLVLPKITETDQTKLRAFIHRERRIELATEWGRFYDLIRWGEAKNIPGFVVGKHELFPIPQTEIDKSNGSIVQNPGY